MSCLTESAPLAPRDPSSGLVIWLVRPGRRLLRALRRSAPATVDERTLRDLALSRELTCQMFPRDRPGLWLDRAPG